VLNKQAAQQGRRKQQGLPAKLAAPDEPLYISMSDVVTLSDADFADLPALTGSQQDPAQSLAALVAGLPYHSPGNS
jgi:hypothetical protein